MHICFIYPSYVRHAQANPEIRDVVSAKSYLGAPTASIALLAACTPEHHQISFYDDRIEEIPFDQAFDLVAMPVFTPAAKRAMDIADIFRSKGVQVVVGGIFSSLMPQEMAPHVDAVCIGEGEPVWHKILVDAERRQLQPIYRSKDYFDLSQLPVPRYDLYFEKEGPDGYRSCGPKGKLTVDYPLQLSRGCPLSCVSCAIPVYMGRRMRFVEPNWVARNFDALKFGGLDRNLCLTEDTTSFGTAKISSHMLESLEACVGVGPRVSYVGASPEQALKATPDFYRLLRALNAISIYNVFGFDNFSRNAFSRDHDPKALQGCIDAVQRIHDEGLGVYASLLVGHDNEDESVFDNILEFADKANITLAEFVILTPYPGTPLWHQLVKEDRILHTDWQRYNDANPVFKPAHYTAERLRQGYIYLWHEFYRRCPDASHAIQV
jgi:radical SAM superfamily enzyme YgiQ (UPF0313 family)